MPNCSSSSGLIYGGDYNPEQWPQSVWLDDMRLMRQANVNFVSIAIFGWASLNPAAGVFEFKWLDTLMDLLAENNIHADLATATAAPPVWLMREYDDVLPVDYDGNRHTWGSRQGYTPNSPSYRRFAAELVRALANRYKNHPALFMWHINNEYACHVQSSYSDADHMAFRRWLGQKYGDIDALNDAWGTAFWSQRYTSFDEILTPRKTPAQNNPGQKLDYRRFFSDAWRECCHVEASILREITPDIPITTNFMGFYPPLDQFGWADDLDMVSWDSYPDPGADRFGAPAGHDLTRSVKRDTPFLLMEQVTAQVNWRAVNRLKPPGMMRLWSLQAVARGADGVAFFQWRKSRAGAEKFHSAMVEHVDPARSRVFAEVCTLGADLKKLEAVAGSTIAADAAILFDWNCWWALSGGDQPARQDYLGVVNAFHRALFARNVVPDLVQPSSDLSRYRVVFAPLLYLLSDTDAANLRAFIDEGGTLVTTFFSGIVDECDRIHLGGYPAPLRDALGLWVEEWQPYAANEGNHIVCSDGQQFSTSVFAEVVHAEGAQVDAAFTDDFFAGSPAVLSHTYGRGRTHYLACWPDSVFLDSWIYGILEKCGVRGPVEAPDGVEAVRRGDFLFLLNHNTAPVTLTDVPDGIDLLTNSRVGGALTINPRDAVVVQLSSSNSSSSSSSSSAAPEA